MAVSVPPSASIRSSSADASASIALVRSSIVYDAADRVDGVRDAAFVQQDLLRAQRHGGALLGRQRERFVLAVAVQRLRAAEHGRQRLQRHAHDVVVGLLRGQRAAGGLRVEAQLLRRAGWWRRSGRA